jgi:hypothetical protein
MNTQGKSKDRGEAVYAAKCRVTTPTRYVGVFGVCLRVSVIGTLVISVCLVYSVASVFNEEFVHLIFAVDTFPAQHAVTCIRPQTILTGPVILTGVHTRLVRVTIIGVNFTQCTFITLCAVTREATRCILADASVEAWLTHTLVNIDFTLVALKTIFTVTRVASSASYDARAPVDAAMVGAGVSGKFAIFTENTCLTIARVLRQTIDADALEVLMIMMMMRIMMMIFMSVSLAIE